MLTATIHFRRSSELSTQPMKPPRNPTSPKTPEVQKAARQPAWSKAPAQVDRARICENPAEASSDCWK